MKTAMTKRIPQLDGLRGVAILMVVVHHFYGDVMNFTTGVVMQLMFIITSLGWSGVDLFFVLSGFLIGGILLDARDSSNYFRVFYRRRLFRIFPLYFAFLAAFFLAARFIHVPELDVYFSPLVPWQACVTFFQNFWMAIHNDFGAGALNPIWSLAVEEQFYLALPLVIYFVRGPRLIQLLAVGIIGAPLTRLALFLAVPNLKLAPYVLLPCRMDALLLGVATAYLARQESAWEVVRAHRRYLWTAIEILTLVCALFLIYPSPHDDTITMLLGYDCFALLYTCILVTCLVDNRLAKVLQAKWLMGLGSIAYCVYLIHQLVFSFVFSMLQGYTKNWVIMAIVSTIVTLILAKLSWEFFEKPCVRFGHREDYCPKGVLEAGIPHQGESRVEGAQVPV